MIKKFIPDGYKLKRIGRFESGDYIIVTKEHESTFITPGEMLVEIMIKGQPYCDRAAYVILEKLRPRVEKGSVYYAIEMGMYGEMTAEDYKELSTLEDDERYASRNYFITEEDCFKAISLISSFYDDGDP